MNTPTHAQALDRIHELEREHFKTPCTPTRCSHGRSTPPELATVQYYDASWGGYRPIDAFGDAPTATFPLRVAHSKARELSQAGRDFRVVEAATDSKPERIVRYRSGARLG